jgi:uncharacterized membrane protein YeaQ/YmgE (transglycosylase-associated protein family)
VGLIVFVFIGAIAGYLGRALMPGQQRMGCLATTGIGMLGSLVGGTLGSLLFERDLDISAAGILGSIVGVIIVLFILSRTGRV